MLHWFRDVQLANELLQCERHPLQLFLSLTFIIFHNITILRVAVALFHCGQRCQLLLVILGSSNILLLLLLPGALLVVLGKLVCIKAGELVYHGLTECSGEGPEVEGLVVEGLVHLCHFNPIRRKTNGAGEVLSQVRPAGMESGSKGEQKVGCGSDVEIAPGVECDFQDEFCIVHRNPLSLLCKRLERWMLGVMEVRSRQERCRNGINEAPLHARDVNRSSSRQANNASINLRRDEYILLLLLLDLLSQAVVRQEPGGFFCQLYLRGEVLLHMGSNPGRAHQLWLAALGP